MEHTKGKWEIKKEAGDVCIVREAKPFTYIATLHGGIPTIEEEANAQLIAAAPETKQQRDDLLAACRRACFLLDQHKINDDYLNALRIGLDDFLKSLATNEKLMAEAIANAHVAPV